MNLPSDGLPTVVAPASRFYALDASRALALLLGIFYHGIESFIQYKPEKAYFTHDNTSSSLLDFIFFTLHAFRMHAFFVIAGFFAHQLYHKRGVAGFVEHRFKRVILPLVLFWPPLHLIFRSLRIWGRQRLRDFSETPEQQVVSPWLTSWNEFWSGQWFNLEGLLMPLYHLWFLYYLVLFCGTALLVRPLLVAVLNSMGKFRPRFDSFFRQLMYKPWAAWVVGLVVAVAMLRMNQLFGVDTPNNNLIPNTRPFLVYSLFFGLGWLLRRQSEVLPQLKTHRHVTLFFSGCLLAGVYVYFLSQSGRAWADTGSTLFSDQVYKAGYGLASTGLVFAFLGYMLHFFSRPNATFRYLADASYWMYLAHFPLVVVLQILVSAQPWPWLLKVAVIFGVSIATLLLSYQYLVRNRWLGTLLNGKAVRKG
ncbi:acyltransferase family protein [Siphonobacter sp.]|uniref:acyltransferase family protein n=1 Tax=Siphonobacter sp. TaxID=1869184 RepID=UPI003B3A4F12